MAASLTKTAGEVEKLFKKLQTPGTPPKTYWQVITEQVEEEGVWDEEFLNLAKEQIGAYLNKFDNEKLFDLWEQSEAASENFTERSELKADSVKSDLKEEILNLVLDKFDSGSHGTNYYEGESYYIENAKEDESFSEEEFSDDIKDIDLNPDDLFDDDDDFFEEDDRF